MPRLLERLRLFDRLDMLVRQAHLQRINVRREMFYLAPAHEREDVRRLVHRVRDGD